MSAGCDEIKRHNHRPEYAELHASCHQLERWSRGFLFTRIDVGNVQANAAPNTILSEAFGDDNESKALESLTPTLASSGAAQRLLKVLAKKRRRSEPLQLTRLAGTEALGERFAVFPRHRGKEVAVALSSDVNDARWWCPTCAAVWRVSIVDGRPKCGDHGEAMRVCKARATGRDYWCCSLSGARSCRSFLWVDETPAASGADWPGASKMVVVFRRGMSGKFRLLDAKQDDDDWAKAQVVMWREDGKAIVFCDGRERRGETAIWQVGRLSEWRSPDPLWEEAQWRSRFEDAEALRAPAFDYAIAETLLDQAYFNGVGNYLRAEILDAADRTPPFATARRLLAQSDTKSRLLDAVVETLRRAVLCNLSGKRMRLKVYRMHFAACEIDATGRQIWFRSADRGELAGPTILVAPWSRVSFARIPPETPREDVLAWFQQFGEMLRFWMNPRRGYGACRYTNVDQARAAVDAARNAIIFGSRIKVDFKRRLRQPDRKLRVDASEMIDESAEGDDIEDVHQHALTSTDEEDDDGNGLTSAQQQVPAPSGMGPTGPRGSRPGVRLRRNPAIDRARQRRTV